jgi:hypothetical protein
MRSQQSPVRRAARWAGSCACAAALLLGAGGLAGCGGDDEGGGGGLGGLKRGGGGGDIEGGGAPPPRPALPAAKPAVAPKKEDPNSPKVAPQTAAELARKRVAWDDFLQHRENPLAAPALDEGAPRAPRAPVAATPGMPSGLDPGMKAWYSDYTVVSTAVKLALTRYTQARDARDERTLGDACRELESATRRLLGDPAAFASPDAAVNQSLRAAYQSFQAAAGACLAGQTAGRDSFIAVSQQHLQQAADALRPYQLAP